MALFTRLGPSDVLAIAHTFGLGTVQDVQSIAAGTINSNFDLRTDRGRWFVRINEGKAEDDVAWEAQLVAALASGGVVTPGPLAAQDGAPYAALPGTRKYVSVFPWRAGHHLAARAITPDDAAQFGAALAQLHRVGLALPPAWRRRSIYDHDHLVARYAAFSQSRDPELAHAIAVIGAGLAAGAAAAAVRARATQGIIHGDLFRDNVLWDHGRVVAILDFEQASGGSLAYDLAVCLNDWCWDDGLRRDVAGGLLAGYQQVRPLTAADRAAILVEVPAAAIRFTITRITDVYLAKVENPDKDFRAFLARCAAWQGEALGELGALL